MSEKSLGALEEARQKIDAIDGQMARLFEERMQQSRALAAYKQQHALSVGDSAREQELVERNRKLIGDGAVESYYVEFLQKVLQLSRDYQSRLIEGMSVAFCGTEGAYAHIAAKKLFPGSKLVAYGDFAGAYRSVECGKNDCVVLPLENSYAGEVGQVLDLTFSGSLFINQVTSLEIVHHLLAAPNASLESVKKVVSHPQALEQCGEYIKKHGFEAVSYSNTALAAKFVKEADDPTVAAIASEETAEIFGLKTLQSGINTSRTNTTRFAVFSRSQNKEAHEHERSNEHFILTFTVKNEANALAQTLNIIGAHGFNLQNLRSRSMKDLLWNYYFYLEAEGDINTQSGAAMLQELSAVCVDIRLVGSYKEGK